MYRVYIQTKLIICFNTIQCRSFPLVNIHVQIACYVLLPKDQMHDLFRQFFNANHFFRCTYMDKMFFALLPNKQIHDLFLCKFLPEFNFTQRVFYVNNHFCRFRVYFHGYVFDKKKHLRNTEQSQTFYNIMF